MTLELAYLVVTGTTTAPRAVEMVRGLLELVPRVLTIATPNAAQVVGVTTPHAAVSVCEHDHLLS